MFTATEPYKNLKLYLLSISIILIFYMLLQESLATQISGTELPYESFLSRLVDSVTGPVAKTMAVVAIVGSVGTLMFGGELSGLLRTLIYLIMGCSIVILSPKIISMVGGSGIVIPDNFLYK